MDTYIEVLSSEHKLPFSQLKKKNHENMVQEKDCCIHCNKQPSPIMRPLLTFMTCLKLSTNSLLA